MKVLQAMALLYILSLGLMYFLSSRHGEPIVLPGDILIKKGTSNIYIPLGSALYISILLYLIFNYLSGSFMDTAQT